MRRSVELTAVRLGVKGKDEIFLDRTSAAPFAFPALNTKCLLPVGLLGIGVMEITTAKLLTRIKAKQSNCRRPAVSGKSVEHHRFALIYSAVCRAYMSVSHIIAESRCWSRIQLLPRLQWTDSSLQPVYDSNMAVYPRSLPRSLTTCPYFWSFVISWSPCFTTLLYCLFLSSARVVSITSLTRSIVHGTRPVAMKFARSLRGQHATCHRDKSTHRSRKSTVTPKSAAMLRSPTTR